MKRFSFSSLHVRLLLLVLLSVIPALGLILYTGLEQRRHEVKYVQSNALQLAKLISTEQERMIVGVRQFLYTLGQLPHVRKLDKVACCRLFADLLKQYPYYLNIGAATIDGNIFASAIPLTQSVNITDRLYFQQAFKTRKFTIGEYQIGRIHGKPSVNFGYPIFDEEDRVKAIIFASLDLDWIYQLASQTELPQGSTVSLIDKEGKILVRYPDPESWIGKTMPEASIINTILVQSEGMFEADDVKGVPHLYVFKSFGSTPYQVGNICVSIGIPISVAFAQVNRILIRNLAFLGFVSLLVLGIAWFLGDLLLLRQVDGLVSVARRLGAGDLTARTGILYNTGEIGQMAQTFDMMAGSLEKRENEGRRAEEEARQVAQENATMAEIGRIISSTLNIDEAYESFSKEVKKIIPFDRIVINTINIEKSTVINVYMTGQGVADRKVGMIYPLKGSGNAEMVRTKSSLLIQTEDLNEYKDRFPMLLSTFQAGFRSIMNVPLFSKGQIIGGVLLRSFKPYAYTDKEVKLAERIGDQIAGAIANAQLFIELKKSEEVLRTEKKRFQILLENAPFGIVMIDKDNTFKYINPKFKELFGYDLNDVPDGKTWFRKAYPNPTYRHDVISAWIKDLKGFEPGEKIRRTFTVNCKDGMEKVVLFIPTLLALQRRL